MTFSAAFVGFANAAGGDLILGVSSDKQVVGVGDTDRLAQYIDNVSFNNCRPPISTVIEILKYKERPVVVIHIPKGDQRPYSTNRGVYFIRTSSGRRQATREELLRLFQATESMFYDETPLLRLDLSAMDMNAVQQFPKRHGQDRGCRGTFPGAVAARLEAGRRRSPDDCRAAPVWPCAAGPPALRSDQCGQNTGYGSGSRTVRPEGPDWPDPGGTGPEQRFLKLHLQTPHRIRGLEPEPRPELPAEALREALVNALAHRDYTVRGPIRLFVFDDRVEFHSPGRLPNTVDEEAMRAGTHVVRNPHIYARFSDAGLVTGAGTGIPRIVRLVRQATDMDIQIAVREFEVLLTLPRRPKRD